ncbi:hypothetical protein ACH5RR_007993 [Cinchona calisaya]|uniref:Uncharacterized protein n=1 Tax=Cinchona calisaya TaxID=153742 RepID=A0ABD3ACP4_9GENT
MRVTARAGGVFLPIFLSLFLSAGSKPGDPSAKKLGSYLVRSQFQRMHGNCLKIIILIGYRWMNPLRFFGMSGEVDSISITMEQGRNECTENAATQTSSPKKAEFGSERTQRKRKEIAPRSKAWIHFRRFLVDGRWRAECLYCHRDYAADTGVRICKLQLGGCHMKIQLLGD